MKSFRIRPMHAGDIDRVIAIAAELKDAPHWSQAAYLAALDIQRTPQRIALVAEAEDSVQVEGFLVASLIPPGSELESIVVAREAQRQGIARQLFSAFFTELSAKSIQDIQLEVRASNQPALSLYRSQIFFEIGRRARYYIDPIEDALLMQKNLLV